MGERAAVGEAALLRPIIGSMLPRKIPAFLRRFIPSFLLPSRLPPEGGELQGVVRFEKEKGCLLPDVVVSASGAETQISDGEGRFTLRFPSQQPGDVVEISVQKAGYVVVHSILLQGVLSGKDTTAPEANKLAPASLIILARHQNRVDMARSYFVNRASSAVAETNLRWLADPQKSSKEERDQTLDKALLALVHVAPFYFKEDSETNSVIYRRALRLFVDGQVDAALQILPSNSWLSHRQGTGGDRLLAREFQLKGRVLVTAFRFEEALRAYANAVAAAPDDFAACHEQALVMDHLDRPGLEVLQAYDRALKVARAAGNVEGAARALDSIGNWHRMKGNAENATVPYEEALPLYRELETKGHANALSQMQFILENLGWIYQEQSRRRQAVQAYEEALRIAGTLDQRSPGMYLDSMAFAASNLGTLQAQGDQLDEARRSHENAKAIYERLSKGNEAKYLPKVAQELCSLVNLAINQSRQTEAENFATEALHIYRQLAKTDPARYAERMSSLQMFLEGL